jgi:hypothetical protein
MTASSPTLAEDAPPIVQITIERIEPGKESEYDAIEEELANVCARLGCPNSYLALLSVDAPKEVWWFVSYSSDAEVARVAAAYASNQPLLDALRVGAAKKSGIAAAPSEHMTKHRPDLSDGSPWRIGTTRFAAIAPTVGTGAVFESADETRFTIAAASTRAAAAKAAARLGPSARVFEVRPTWSRPAREWTAANAELWGAD